tara:strand:+ start:1843 stop:3060 length:1218 start_codon:yes stop_codon:yes gene_type:complete
MNIDNNIKNNKELDFKSKLIKKHKHTNARSLEVTTPHGKFITPKFMPVATRAFVNNMYPEDLRKSGSTIILGGNTYHMLVNPGLDIIKAAKGMHKFMNWHAPMLTDSGGFQVFSLSKNSKICKITENGAIFKHPINGKKIELNSETSIKAQKVIGADIIMTFDECAPDNSTYDYAKHSLKRTQRWYLRSLDEHYKNTNSEYGLKQALFAIVQGASFQDLREESLDFILQHNPDGIAIGGESIGFDMDKTCEIINWLRPQLESSDNVINKLRYTMGVGLDPQNLLDVVREGIDVFDCVAPTRNARHGALYCGKIVEDKGNHWLKFISEDGSDNKARILIKKTIYAKDESPIMADCSCYTCKNYTRAYMHFLFKSDAALYYNLACIHNVHVMHDTMYKALEKITNDT